MRIRLAAILACLVAFGLPGRLAWAADRAAEASAPMERVAAAPDDAVVGRATVSPQRRIHILYGDRTGGGHRAGSGEPGKTLFPASWSDDDIIAAIESVANDPRARRAEQPNGRMRVEGTRRGVRIRVIVGADGTSIITGYPLQPRARQ